MSRPAHAPETGPGHRRQRRVAGFTLTVCSLALIAAVTLSPESSAGSASAGPWCFGCGEFGTVDVVLNLLLFMPLGAGLRTFGAPWRRALILTAAVAATVEWLQWLVIPGRDPSLADLLLNTLGGCLGIGLARYWSSFVAPGPAGARRLAAGGLAGWCVLRLVTGLLLAPAFPAPEWYGQLAPESVYPADFRGQLISATVAGKTLQEGRLPGGAAWLGGDPLAVVAQVVTGTPTPALASVLSIMNSGRTEVLLLAQEGDAARFRVRLRAADAGLRVPSVALPAAFRSPGGTALALTATLSERTLRLSATGPPTAVAASLPLSAGLTWALFLPADVGLGPWSPWVTAAVAAVLWLVLGFWCGRSAVPTTVSLPLTGLAAGGVLVLGFLLPPLLTAAAPSDLTEWLGAGVGLSAGLSLGFWRARKPL